MSLRNLKLKMMVCNPLISRGFRMLYTYPRKLLRHLTFSSRETNSPDKRLIFNKMPPLAGQPGGLVGHDMS